MKNLIKAFLYHVVGKPLFRLVRPFYLPSEEMRKRLRFIGPFGLETREGHQFQLYNQAFHLETDFFWIGYERYDWERQTRRIWTHLCRHSDTILDIGANTGVFAVLAKLYHPEALVVAFEPQPNVYRVLQRNNALNWFDIRCENLALSDQDGELPFYNFGPDAFTTENTTAGSLNPDWRSTLQSSIQVPVKQLHNYLAENLLPPVDLLKIDVETHEPAVLRGYGPLLAAHQPIMIVEIQDPAIGDQIHYLLEKHDYLFFHIDESQGLRPVDSLGRADGDLNHLLCPVSKLPLVQPFVVGPAV